jgi:hypothetical protein
MSKRKMYFGVITRIYEDGESRSFSTCARSAYKKPFNYCEDKGDCTVSVEWHDTIGEVFARIELMQDNKGLFSQFMQEMGVGACQMQL